MIESDVSDCFRKAVESLDRGESFEDAMGELSPEMWRALPPGSTRAIVKSALSRLFSDPPTPEAEELMRETEAELRESTLIGRVWPLAAID